jgi:hypothetical protein
MQSVMNACAFGCALNDYGREIWLPPEIFSSSDSSHASLIGLAWALFPNGAPVGVTDGNAKLNSYCQRA